VDVDEDSCCAKFDKANSELVLLFTPLHLDQNKNQNQDTPQAQVQDPVVSCSSLGLSGKVVEILLLKFSLKDRLRTQRINVEWSRKAYPNPSHNFNPNL